MPPLVIAKSTDKLTELGLLPNMANRHGLIAGATGTGKTVSLQVLAEAFSDIGVPVFAADIKGDLSGVSQVGGGNQRVDDRLAQLKITDHAFKNYPVEFWDVFGDQGTPIRATVSEMGPLLFGRLLNLNDVQNGVLNIVFKFCDDNGMLLLDLKDLRTAVQYVGDNASDFTSQYGQVATASIGAIQRGLLLLETQSGEEFFGEPALSFTDFIATDSSGKGTINILTADKLFQQPLLYSTFLLWMMSELYENLPECGDLDKPKLVFFFDEAHLLFKDAPKALEDKIEQVIRLIRSKGVGIYFITQNPADIPDVVLGQLGNRVQHALRAFTPSDLKGVRAAADTFRPNPSFKIELVITELGVGEALVSFLDEKGAPTITERSWIVPPHAHIGAITPDQRTSMLNGSTIRQKYVTPVDRDSAYEQFLARASEQVQAPADSGQMQQESAPQKSSKAGASIFDKILTSATRSASSQIGRSIARGVLGSIFGGSRK